MHRRYVEGYCKSSSRHGKLVENTLLIAEGILYVTNLYHNILLVFGLSISDISGWCHWSGQYCLWYIDQFYILFWIRLESGTAYCLSWRYLHWFDIEITSCVVDTEHCGVHSLQVMRTQLETLGEEFKLAGNIWWREPTMLWVWTLRCIGIVKTMAIFGHLICLRVLWWDVSVLWGQYLHHRHRDLFIVPEKTLAISMRTILFWEDFGLHCGLAITVVERLQRYNCIWLTYIDNVEQNILFYIEVGSCEMLSLCGKLIWRRSIVFWLCFVFRRRLYRYLVWITSFLRS